MKQYLQIFLLGYMFVLSLVSSEDAALEDVYLRHVYGENRSVYLQFRLNESAALLQSGKLCLLEQIILYVSGWNEKIDEAPTTIDITDAFLHRKKENFIVLNYDKIAAELYTTAVSKVVPLAKEVALALSNLFKSGLKVAKFHCIGFSLGAHICGAIARELKALNPTYVVLRISGLDPAGLSYSKTSKNVGLSQNDATFVDVIHTNAGIFGQSYSSGDADFYTNNDGKGPQPGCPTGLAAILAILLLGHCDHDKAVHYYANSVRGEKYVATQKISKLTALMGYFCPKNTRGDYYVTIK